MQPVSVGSADEAMTALRTAAADGEPFEVAVLDLLLPDIDGLALARAIRAGSAEGSLHLLLLSSSHHVDADAARAAGIAPVPDQAGAPVGAVRQPGRRRRDRRASTQPRPPRRPSVGASAGRKVLVVEDNQVNQMVATGLLESAGYAADVVADGIEAVDALAGRARVRRRADGLPDAPARRLRRDPRDPRPRARRARGCRSSR